MTSTFDRIRSGLSSLGTRFKMGNEQSQQSQVDSESQHSQDEGVPSSTSDSSSDSEVKHEQKPLSQQKKPVSSPPSDQTTLKQRKRARKKKDSSRTRRLSNSASTVTTESILSEDVALPAGKRTVSGNEAVEDEPKAVTETDSPNLVTKKQDSPEATAAIYPGQKSPVEANIKTSPATMQQQRNAAVSATPTAKSTSSTETRTIVSKRGRSRYPCPEATSENCKETFSMLSDAKRHAQMAHTKAETSQCFICQTEVQEGDALRTHMATHSTAQLQSPRNPRSTIKTAKFFAENQSESSPSPPDVQPHKVEAQVTVSENLDEQASSESAGHEELSNNVQKLHIQSSQRDPSSFESLQAIPDSDPPQMTEPAAAAPEKSLPKAITTPDSGFDEPMEQEIVQETPKTTRALKRRRDPEENEQVPIDTASPSKRARRSIFSPPRSSSPNEPVEAMPVVEPAQKPKLRSLRSLSGRSGNLESFAKPIAPGSQLYHPIHNPRTPKSTATQRAQVVIPRTSKAGPSSVVSSNKILPTLAKSNSENDKGKNTESVRSRKSAYTSPKGKRRAEPGIEYSTPTKGGQSQAVDNDKEADSSQNPQKTDRSGIATTVARRTNSKGASQKSAKLQKNRRDDGDDEPSDSDSDSDSDIPFEKDTDADKASYICQECHRRYDSLDALRRHEKTADIHSQLHICEECPAKFVSRTKLSEHQSKTGHGDGTGDVGRKGHFSQGEINKLHAWRDRFCDEFDLDLTEFNQIMTDSCRRSKGFDWPHRFITKKDFLQQYTDTLPSRSRRSMLRYRERSFQNVPDNQKWTEEDDDELVNLVKEIGQKWVEIGQRMTRTSDSVNQRWRHKLKYRGKALDGEWLPQETEQLVKAINQVKRESNLSLDPNEDVRIPWDLVSNKLKGKRTAQQCSNKWRLMHTHKKGGRRIRTSGVDRLPSTPAFMATPSKMSRRLAGSTPQTQTSNASASTAKKRKKLSDEIVAESDDEGVDQESDQDRVDDEKASNVESDGSRAVEGVPMSPQKRQKQSQSTSTRKAERNTSSDESDEDRTGSPVLPKNPLPARTPRNGLSVSQLMNQTQANTSALRGTTTTRKQTQAERPSPNIPIQRRPESSPLHMIGRNGTKKGEAEESGSGDDNEDEDVEEDERESNKSASLVEDEASEASNSEEEQERSENSEDSSESSEDDSVTDVEDKATSQQSFLQSLRSPQNEVTSKTAASGSKDKRKKMDLTQAIRRGTQATPSEEESESESDDNEGDIMYRS